MVALKKIAAILALTACQTNMIQAQPLEHGNDNPDALVASSSIPADTTSSIILHERSIVDANHAAAEFFKDYMVIPMMCVGVVYSAHKIVITWTTEEQRRAAYDCIARQFNRLLPPGREVTGDDIQMTAHRIGNTAEAILDPVNDETKKMI